MDTQEHEYELGMLEENILDRDETQARQGGNRGDERRWMILGGAGTLALMTAIVAAVALGGAGEPHKLSASLRGPVRDLSAFAAHVQSSATDITPAAVASKTASKAASKARIARAEPSVPQPTAIAPLDAAPTPAPTPTPAPASKPVSATTPVSPAAEAEPAETSFANLPTVSATEEAAETVVPAEEVPTNFEQDDNPFAEDPSESEDEPDDSSQDDEASDDEDEAELPAPANDVAVAAPTPV